MYSRDRPRLFIPNPALPKDTPILKEPHYDKKGVHYQLFQRVPESKAPFVSPTPVIIEMPKGKPVTSPYDASALRHMDHHDGRLWLFTEDGEVDWISYASDQPHFPPIDEQRLADWNALNQAMRTINRVSYELVEAPTKKAMFAVTSGFDQPFEVLAKTGLGSDRQFGRKALARLGAGWYMQIPEVLEMEDALRDTVRLLPIEGVLYGGVPSRVALESFLEGVHFLYGGLYTTYDWPTSSLDPVKRQQLLEREAELEAKALPVLDEHFFQ